MYLNNLLIINVNDCCEYPIAGVCVDIDTLLMSLVFDSFQQGILGFFINSYQTFGLKWQSLLFQPYKLRWDFLS